MVFAFVLSKPNADGTATLPPHLGPNFVNTADVGKEKVTLATLARGLNEVQRLAHDNRAELHVQFQRLAQIQGQFDRMEMVIKTLVHRKK